jgi:ankyrin repeat protein
MAKKVKTTKGKKKVKRSTDAPKKTVDVHLPPITDVRCATLQTAIINEDLSSLQRLVAHYDYEKDLTRVDVNGSTLIHIAIKKEDPVMLNRLLEYKKININALESFSVGGGSALHLACHQNFREGIEILLKNGSNPNMRSQSANGETALMVCAKLGHIECGKLLLSHGASLNTVDNFGNNVSFWANEYHQDRFIRECHLPAVHTATAEEFIQLLLRRNPRFILPSVKKTKKKGDGKGKKKK